jgi:hypothetical protein
MKLLLVRSAALALAVATSWPAAAIVGGSEGGPGEASAVMVLNDRGGICTGVVVARDVVLTAAHCVPPGPQVRVHWREGGQPVLQEVAGVARHPEYRADAVAQRARSIDLALVRTSQPLPSRFSPATLAAATAQSEAALTAAGFGLAAEGDARTAGTWRSAALPLTQPYGPSRVLYWLGGAAGTGACQGDSGGPVFDGAQRVTGVISWTTGAQGRKCGNLTQAVMLAPQRGWIDQTLARWGGSASWR